MPRRLARLVDLRPGEPRPFALAFAHVTLVVAAYLLAKPLRNGLFLEQHGPYALVYVYAAVPAALALVVPAAARLSVRLGQRAVAVATLWLAAASVLAFWMLFRFAPFHGLAAVFYVWVNCFGVVAPVQAWSLAGAAFDARQAKRLFGLVGAGASLGAVGGGLLGRLLVGPVGGAVNLLLVLALLVAAAAVVVTLGGPRGSPRAEARAGAARTAPIAEILRHPYLRLLAALVFLVAIATQWIGFQFSVVSAARFGGDADRLTAFFSTVNVVLGVAALAIQVLVTAPLLRRFGLPTAVVALPSALLAGTLLVAAVPGFWPVLLATSCDQGLRFSIDKAAYELLYVPIPPSVRAWAKPTIDIVVNRTADAVGALLLGLATRGFFGLGGLGFGVRETAAVNAVLVALWLAVAWRLRAGYVEAIARSIREHRLEAERAAAAAGERTAAEALERKLGSEDPRDVLYALDALAAAPPEPGWAGVRAPHPALYGLLRHRAPEVRRRALALLNDADDRAAVAEAERLLRDDDLETRAEALFYLSRHPGIDPATALRQLTEVPEPALRAAMAAFLARPGRAENPDAARAIVDAMLSERGPDAPRVHREALRVIELRPEIFADRLARLLAVPTCEPAVVRHA
ncbi:MAG TPA: hypothetical protein VNI83_11630, partial [Vicinamibacterales bacterium]|nr:hypothetical protein [Vicinamibacterales bacterium]